MKRRMSLTIVEALKLENRKVGMVYPDNSKEYCINTALEGVIVEVHCSNGVYYCEKEEVCS